MGVGTGKYNNCRSSCRTMVSDFKCDRNEPALTRNPNFYAVAGKPFSFPTEYWSLYVKLNTDIQGKQLADLWNDALTPQTYLFWSVFNMPYKKEKKEEKKEREKGITFHCCTWSLLCAMFTFLTAWLQLNPTLSPWLSSTCTNWKQELAIC